MSNACLDLSLNAQPSWNENCRKSWLISTVCISNHRSAVWVQSMWAHAHQFLELSDHSRPRSQLSKVSRLDSEPTRQHNERLLHQLLHGLTWLSPCREVVWPGMSPKMEVHIKCQVYKMVVHEVVLENLEHSCKCDNWIARRASAISCGYINLRLKTLSRQYG